MGSSMTALEAAGGEVVVLGSQLPRDSEMWRPQIDALSPHYRVVVPHLWAMAARAQCRRPTRIGAISRARYLALLDNMGIQRFAMVGLRSAGCGGRSSLCSRRRRSRAGFARYLPGRRAAIAAPVLLGARCRRGQPLAPRCGWLDVVRAAGSYPAMSRRPPGSAGTLPGQAKEWDRDRLVDAVVPLGRLLFGRRDALADLARLTLPAVGHDGAAGYSPTPSRRAARWRRPWGCPFIELPCAGHISSLETPGAVTDRLLGFLPRPSEGTRAAEKPLEPEDPIPEIEE